jgi:hypothetical protein
MPQFTGSFVVFLLLASCATSTEDERAERIYEREDELILAREEFERRSVECRRNGGMMQNLEYSASRSRKLTAHDYRKVQCVKQYN